MHALIFLSAMVAVATASVIPYGYGAPWGDYGHHHHHHVPVATSYASIWKVDHSVPVVVKPVVKEYPAWGYGGWGHGHHHDHLDHHLYDHHDHYGHGHHHYGHY